MNILASIFHTILKHYKPDQDEAEAAWMVASQEYFVVPKEVKNEVRRICVPVGSECR